MKQETIEIVELFIAGALFMLSLHWFSYLFGRRDRARQKCEEARCEIDRHEAKEESK